MHLVYKIHTDADSRQIVSIQPTARLQGGMSGTITFPPYQAYMDDPADIARQQSAAYKNARETLEMFYQHPSRFIA
jgi:hypothetical protein